MMLSAQVDATRKHLRVPGSWSGKPGPDVRMASRSECARFINVQRLEVTTARWGSGHALFLNNWQLTKGAVGKMSRPGRSTFSTCVRSKRETKCQDPKPRSKDQEPNAKFQKPNSKSQRLKSQIPIVSHREPPITHPPSPITPSTTHSTTRV